MLITVRSNQKVNHVRIQIKKESQLDPKTKLFIKGQKIILSQTSRTINMNNEYYWLFVFCVNLMEQYTGSVPRKILLAATAKFLQLCFNW